MQYEIIGGTFPAVVCHLQAGEAMRTERGSMIWMDPCMQMQTQGGGLGKMFGKMVSGESMFQNIYTAAAPGKIAFGSSFPGRIMAIQLVPGSEFIVQKSGFLASEMDVELSVFINKRIGGAFCGG
ncbi:MAG: AIM24 family protein, partial [Coriobacteriales bacterium]|nr:AIM24 family protein [Coriobacteriales bacterium]